MDLHFPLSDVTLMKVDETRRVQKPEYADRLWQMNQNEFAMQVDEVGTFYACDGNRVEYAPENGVSLASLEVYLNGSVYGAILHQRKILPIHGSSFIEKGMGIMLCGESGAGKSSLTAAFCLDGAEFLTDDVTPIVFKNQLPEIMPLSDRIKLWQDCLKQLERKEETLVPIWEGETKYYYPMEKNMRHSVPLEQVFIIETGDFEQVEHSPVTGVEAFSAIRNEVYRWEYLSAMPESEKRYLEQLIIMSTRLKITRIKRPGGIGVKEMKTILRELI